MAEGEFALICKHLEKALRLPVLTPGEIDPAADHDLFAMLADAAAKQRDPETLKMYAHRATETAANVGHVLYEAIAFRALGVLKRLEGDFSTARKHFDDALQRFRSLEAGWQIGRTLCELGELAAEEDQMAVAQKRYQEALHYFQAVGAVPDARSVTAALDNLKEAR